MALGVKNLEQNNITRIQYEGKEIVLVGTAHVLEDSARLVRQAVEEEKPDSICVELDEGRYRNLKNPRQWEQTDIVQVIKSHRVGFLIANLALSTYQKKMARQLGTQVGGEMLEGIRLAEETGARLVLADRDIQTTFLRIWRKLSLWEKCKLFVTLFFSFDEDEKVTDDDLRQLLETDRLEEMIGQLRQEFPSVGQVLISERDQHLAAKIKAAPGPKVLAVLGGAHMPGVAAEIPKRQNLGEITAVPEKGRSSKIAGWLVPVLIVALIAYGFVGSWQSGLEKLTTWALWNSSMAALFTLLAMGHPASIVTSFLMAPFSALNPFLVCGWFTGLVEAHFRRPTVQDVSRVPEDMFHLKGIWHNRFLRILLIIIMANLGSVTGTLIGGMDLIRRLF